MKLNAFLLSANLLFAAPLTAQEASDLLGLWEVTMVLVGDEEMTPNAKWTRLNADYTQESGNGWFQHTTGSWSFDEASKKLVLISDNGLKDSFGAFKVVVAGERMSWERTEEGTAVKVSLVKVEELPLTFRDQILGLWGLQNMVGRGDFFEDEKSDNYLFIRWDGKFVIGTNGKKIYGVYNVHGHKPEIELIPYSKDLGRSFWAISFSENKIALRLLNNEEEVSRGFARLDDFPK